MSTFEDRNRGELPEEVVEFLVESNENLDRVDQDLMALESNPTDKDRLSSVFRAIHTVKGTCGFLGYTRLESVAHVGENLLSKLRDGDFILNPVIADALLAMVDAVRQMLTVIEATGGDGEQNYPELVARLSELAQTGGYGTVEAGAAPEAAAPSASGETDIKISNSIVFGKVASEDEPTQSTPPTAASPTEAPAPADIDKQTSVATSAPAVAPVKAESEVGGPTETRGGVSDNSIRVDVSLLDRLMDLVGELVLARNQILQYTVQDTSSALVSTTQRLNLITSELQESVMKTRMQPIGNILSKFPRVVRDLARATGKNVRLDIEGKETELDRTIIEAIKDPMTHLIRNGVDHAIEPPEGRASAGKPAEGLIVISAYHEGGYVNIEIRDDGAGIDPAKLRVKAVEKGVIGLDAVAKLSDREVTSLIFAPGFSTAEKITNVSGRGVGMDVVKTNIERIGGSIEVNSTVGVGTTFRIRIPLTLAIVPALIAITGSSRYAIPQTSLVELLRLEPHQVENDVTVLDGAPVLRLRGNLLPLVDFAEVLGVERAEKHEGEIGTMNIAVLQTEDTPFGLIVDGVVDTQEIVVKPLGKQVKSVTIFSGATIMGDGRVALIVDVSGIGKLGRILRESTRDHSSRLEEETEVENVLGTKQTLLIVQVGESGRVALPLQTIDRLEEFDPSVVEWAGGQPVVQYRGFIMPLIWLSSAVGVSPGSEVSENYQVVVHTMNGRSVGVVVDSILDITEQRVKIDAYSARLGVLGSAVISDKVTEVVDLSVIIGEFIPDTESLGV